ncbi:MAG: tRNA (adenosine(37)-N6)-threonylcarbamoyltransferase complex dimerization subunit type 1 TsaB [Chlorobiaceae bacterium]|nr:tRNA (adenosine(37)-N6)-threonylcarbamoyltransferase complex dimerization subunit type 1 TsaB [Chlorobiaceae bacterium]NTV61391.1 tRNA (adenosine(37)-N6)-threonylcarbamoyltransferase complex dimerization subunit type 1 TsaB [Chlorobiaceae bacterium]
MNILAIECSHISFSAAVQKGGEVFEACGAEWQKTAEGLVPLIAGVIEKSGLERSALDCVAFSSGPGSFTALRIGISAAKGIAWGLGLSLAAVPTLPAMASSLQCSGVSVMAVVQSRKGEYFHACFSPEELSPEAWHGNVERGDADAVVSAALAAPPETVVVGRQLLELHPLLDASGIRHEEAGFFSASSLLPAARIFCCSADPDSLGAVAPDYRQMFVPGVGGV